MGDVADDMLEGFICQICGQIVDRDAPGYPRTCEECKEEDDG